MKVTEEFIGGSFLHVSCGENSTSLGKPISQLVTKEETRK
jgi:hypothetical protein